MMYNLSNQPVIGVILSHLGMSENEVYPQL
jgi:hypothetical protein